MNLPPPVYIPKLAKAILSFAKFGITVVQYYIRLTKWPKKLHHVSKMLKNMIFKF